MMTREGFEDLIDRFRSSLSGFLNETRFGGTARKAYAKQCNIDHAALLAAFDTQAARIAELEADRDHWRNLVNDLEHNSIYLDSIAYYEGRIAELESAIALSISDLDWYRIASARDRLFEMVKIDETEES